MKAHGAVTMLFAVVLSAAALPAIAGCAAPATSVAAVSAPDPRLDGTWHLVTGRDAKGRFDLDGSDITLTIGTFTGGSSPCNGYSATVSGGVGVVYVQAFQSADGEDCPNQAATELDARYLAALQRSRFSTLADGQLTLESPSATLLYSKTALAVPDIERGTWLLARLSGNPRAHGSIGAYNPPVSLEFDGYNGLKMTSACSDFQTDYTVDGSSVTVGSLLVGIESGRDCTSAGRVIDERLQLLLFSPFTAEISYAAGDRGTTLTITNKQAGLAAVFLPGGVG